MSFVESTVEDAALQWLSELGFFAKHSPHIAPGESATLTAGKLHAGRTGFGETVLAKRLSGAVRVSAVAEALARQEGAA